jgi:lariat debranching enzyme
MRIAIEGCLHGELDILYNTVKFIEQQHQTKIDLLIVCGDFQAVRNEGSFSRNGFMIDSRENTMTA